MILNIESIEFAYNLLKEGPPSRESVEPWKRAEYDSANEGRQLMTFSYDRVLLPCPLKFANLHLKRFGGDYSADLVVVGEAGKVFHDAAEKFGEDIRKHKMIWAPVNDDAEGYILYEPDESGKPNNIVNATIIKGGDNDEARLIGIGTNGARPRALNGLREFERHMSELEIIANVMINAVLLNSPAREKIPEDLILSLCF